MWGILATATHDELARLYGRDWARAYLPEAVTVMTDDGALRSALSYIAPCPTAERPFENHLERISHAAGRLGFPQSYWNRLENLR